jgi:hypothetical protein
MCGYDIQFLCGAGLQPTKDFLAAAQTDDSRDALQYIERCEQAGDFDDWEPSKWITYYQQYFHLNQSPEDDTRNA